MAPRQAADLDEAKAQRCRELVYAAAEKYQVPPAYIVAHIRGRKVDAARHEVMRSMLTELKLRRWQVAAIFCRDLRRVRKSVLGC